MKIYTYLLTILLLIGFTSVNAQVAETEASMSDGTQSALVLDTDVNRKDAEKMWKEYVKKIGKVDWDRKNREHLLFNKVIPDIDREYPVTVITKFEDNKVTFWFKMDDEYLNSDNDKEELKGAGKWIQQYAYQVERKSVGEQLKDEEKNLGKLEKDLRKLEKQNDKFHKEIEKAKEKIANAEANIVQNLEDQEAKAKEISDQKEKVGNTKKAMSDIGKS